MQRGSSDTIRRAERAPSPTNSAKTVERTRRVATQTAERMAGGMPAGSQRIVSLHDADARAIKKGRLGKPVEFSYKAQLVDREHGALLVHNSGDGQSSRRCLDARGGDKGYESPHGTSTAGSDRRPRLWRGRY